MYIKRYDILQFVLDSNECDNREIPYAFCKSPRNVNEGSYLELTTNNDVTKERSSIYRDSHRFNVIASKSTAHEKIIVDISYDYKNRPFSKLVDFEYENLEVDDEN